MPSGPLAREAPAGAASALFRSRDARSPARQPLREPDGDKRAGFCVLPEEWGGSASRRLTPPSPPCPPARPREAARVSAARPGRAGLGSPAAFPPLWVSTGCRGLAAASPGCAGGGARLGLAAGRPCLRGAGLPFPRPPSRPSPQPEPPPLPFSLSPVAPRRGRRGSGPLLPQLRSSPPASPPASARRCQRPRFPAPPRGTPSAPRALLPVAPLAAVPSLRCRVPLPALARPGLPACSGNASVAGPGAACSRLAQLEAGSGPGRVLRRLGPQGEPPSARTPTGRRGRRGASA